MYDYYNVGPPVVPEKHFVYFLKRNGEKKNSLPFKAAIFFKKRISILFY